MPRFLTAGLCLAALVPAACDRGGADSHAATVVDGAGRAEVALNGLVVVVEAPVEYRLNLSTVSASSSEESGTSRSATINGYAFGTKDDVFYIGEARFGRAVPGDTVRVTEDGVFVNGERRGDTPGE